MNLWKALRLGARTRAALVGAGGKTTALFQMARAWEGPVVVTTSTHLGPWQASMADRHLLVTRPEDLLSNAGQIEGVTLVTGPEVGAPGGERLSGLDAATLDALGALSQELGFPVLVEADGARQLPLKAPAAHEPVIPAWVDLVVVTAGLSGLGHPLDGATVHRPEKFAETGALRMGEPIDAAGLARVLLHEEGGRKGIPKSARSAVLLNQAADEDLARTGQAMARELVPTFDAAVVADLAEGRIWSVHEPAVGIVLAAGGASRFGTQKLLQPWQGRPLVRAVVETALSSSLEEVIVVTGADAETVENALEGLPVRITRNAGWQRGQSTSLRAGLAAALEDSPGPSTGAALFFLADQPFVPAELARGLVDLHARTQAAIVAPRAGGRRGNPALFDRDLFGALMEVEGDTGGRALFERYPVEFLDWEDPAILLDVDTREDWERLRGPEGQTTAAEAPLPARGKIAAVVLAAGQSRRMGSPKMVLPWGNTTVIGAAVDALQAAGAAEVVVVTGGARAAVEAALQGSGARTVHNAQYEQSEMVVSLQEGLRALSEEVSAVLVALGDQPGIPAEVIGKVLERHRSSGSALVVPSYQMRRGHPWLAARELWPSLLALEPDQTLRDFLRQHAGVIDYVDVDSPAILKDLDTPEDYAAQKPDS